ncbi:MAG: C1 family peptidase [Kiritimatiellae bacterium]|nr:C1 family peptidase [Kiritimatiellia bacterium]
MQRVFDRIARFDERSRAFNIRTLFRKKEFVPVTKIWGCRVHLDQGSEGACTGFGTAHELASDPVRVPRVTARLARKIYNLAKTLDQWAGEDYEGSSVLAAAKAAKELGYYQEYRWSFDVDDLRQAICEIGPAVIGVNWTEHMEHTDNHGFIRARGKVMGGHCVCIRGWSNDQSAFIGRNSWGRSWGMNGDFYISYADLKALLADDGEACIPLVRTTGEKA